MTTVIACHLVAIAAEVKTRPMSRSNKHLVEGQTTGLLFLYHQKEKGILWKPVALLYQIVTL